MRPNNICGYDPAAIQRFKSLQRCMIRVNITPPEELSRNYSYFLYTREMSQITPDIFKHLLEIISVSGERLRRLVKSIFPNSVEGISWYGKTFTYLSYVISEPRDGPVLWSHDTYTIGSDMASLWAHYNCSTYTTAIETLYNHLLKNEPISDTQEFNDLKPYWVHELYPLRKCIPEPTYCFPFCSISGTPMAIYYRQNIPVAISFEDAAHRVFFSLMRHRKDGYLKWFPVYPTSTELFFLDDVYSTKCPDILFVKDEKTACNLMETDQSVKPHFLSTKEYPVPLAFPGGLERLSAMDLSITLQKDVHIQIPFPLSEQSDFINGLAKKIRDVGAKSLRIYQDEHGKLIHDLKFEKMSTHAPKDCRGEIVQPGFAIPGADIPQEVLLDPIIESGQIIWIYGPEKSGKSWFARSLAHVMSYGENFLGKYMAKKKRQVLFVDGEMTPPKLQKAFDMELQGLKFSEGVKLSLKSARALDNEDGEINLNDEAWQDWFNQRLRNFDVIFFDCYYSLMGNSNSTQNLLRFMRNWTKIGKTFVIIDHTNKKSQLQGTLDKPRAADLCIEITPLDDKARRIQVSFPTVRSLKPEDTEPYILHLKFTDDSFQFKLENKVQETKYHISGDLMRKIFCYVLITEKKRTQVKLAAEIGFSDSTLSNWKKEIEELTNESSIDPQRDEVEQQIEDIRSMKEEEITAMINTLKKHN